MHGLWELTICTGVKEASTLSDGSDKWHFTPSQWITVCFCALVFCSVVYQGQCVSKICSIPCHMTAANWETFTDGLLSRVYSCMVRLMLWLVYVYMPAAGTGLARGNDSADIHWLQCRLLPEVGLLKHCYLTDLQIDAWEDVQSSIWSDFVSLSHVPFVIDDLVLNCGAAHTAHRGDNNGGTETDDYSSHSYTFSRRGHFCWIKLLWN